MEPWESCYIKLNETGAAFTHTLNELRYYINTGIVILICAAAFILAPKRKLTLIVFLGTIPLQIALKYWFPAMNYFVRPMWVILIGFTAILLASRKGFIKDKLYYDPATPRLGKAGIGLLLSLAALHIIFH